MNYAFAFLIIANETRSGNSANSTRLRFYVEMASLANTDLHGCFIMPKIHCLHRAQVLHKHEQRLRQVYLIITTIFMSNLQNECYLYLRY